MLFPLLYKEVELLAAVIGDWRLTTAIPAWESALFAGQPSLYLSERLAFVPLSEYLHFCYLSYVIVIPSVAAYWYVSGRRAAFGELLLMLSTVLLGSYLFFILLPVDSPYYLSPRLGPPLSGHFFFDLVHQMSARGGARGGAFPSAHVSGAVVVSLVAWRHQRRLAYLLIPLTGSVMIATVYGRFHYVLDTLAGAALAIAVVVAYRYLSGDGLMPERFSIPRRARASAPAASIAQAEAWRYGSRTASRPPPTSTWHPYRLSQSLSRSRRLVRDDLCGRDFHALLQLLDRCGFALGSEREPVGNGVLPLLTVLDRDNHVVTLDIPHRAVGDGRRADSDGLRGRDCGGGEERSRCKVDQALGIPIDHELLVRLDVEHAGLTARLHPGEQDVLIDEHHLSGDLLGCHFGLAGLLRRRGGLGPEPRCHRDHGDTNHPST